MHDEIDFFWGGVPSTLFHPMKVNKKSSTKAIAKKKSLKRALNGSKNALERNVTKDSVFKQFAFENASFPIIWSNEKGQLIYGNKALCNLMGCSAEEIPTKTLYDINPNLDETTLRNLWRRLKSEGHIQGESCHRNASGKWIPVEVNAHLMVIDGEAFCCSFARDITERKKGDDILRLHSQILSQIHDAVVTTDMNGYVTSWNKGAERLMGYSESEALGKHASFMYPPDDQEILYKEVIEPVQRKGAHEAEVRTLTKFGTTYIAQLSLSLLRDPSGNSIGMIGYSLDCTEKKRAEKERLELLDREQKARNEAEQANRAKDLFLATLSHELRTPLTTILSWAQMLRMGKIDPSKHRLAAEMIEESAKTQAQLINDLLDVSRIITGKLQLELQEINPSVVIKETIESIRPTAEAKSLTIHTQIDESVGMVMADSVRLQQIFWNLISNSIKFTPEGGSIDIRLERAMENVRVRIRDTGKGILKGFLPHIFTPFSQADSSTTRRYSGLGLGLAIVHNLVTLHKGVVQAESSGEGMGATFTVELPLVWVPKIENIGVEKRANVGIASSITDRKDESLLSPVLDGITVLLVDDEPNTRNALAEILKAFGAETYAVASVAAALDSLQKHKCDILVSDLAMPGEDGYSLIKKVRALKSEQCSWVPSIALTAYAGKEVAERALSAGFDAYLTKPIDGGELATTIAKLCIDAMNRNFERARMLH